MTRRNRNKSSRKSRNTKNQWLEIGDEYLSNKQKSFNENRSDIKHFLETYTEEDIKKFNKRINRQVILTPRGENQKNYVFSLQNPNTYITFGIGPAGSGKTLLATQVAVKELAEKKIDKIVITRPNVAVDDKEIGYLPGGIYGKMAPWIMPILDVFKDYYSPKEVKKMIDEEIIDIVPIAFMRGRTFKNSFIIVDEAQGTSPNSLLAILTRIGENSKMAVTGDLKQTDHKGFNGLSDFLKKYENYYDVQGIDVITFDNTDIQRHPVIDRILTLYEGSNLPSQSKEKELIIS